ncbi:hypothetical protein Tco_1051483, partial [Tanacetum coccineum]
MDYPRFSNSLSYLKKAQQLEPKLYDGNVIKNTSAIVIPDSEETLMLAEESRSKMLLKQKDPMMLEKKVNTTPVDYTVLNQLSQDFETRFVPQTELSAEQAFWSQNSVNSLDPTLSSRPTKVEVPKELPKVSMVNTSLKKLKHHLASFDVVVKARPKLSLRARAGMRALTRITTTAEVPLRKPTALESDTPKPVVLSNSKMITWQIVTGTLVIINDWDVTFSGFTTWRTLDLTILRRSIRMIRTLEVAFVNNLLRLFNLEQFRTALHEMTPATISSGLVPNPPPSTPFVPPSRTDWGILFQPLFDELLNAPSSVDRPVPKVIAPIAEVVAPEPVASTGLPSSTTVDQDAPSTCNSQTTPETQSPVIPNDVEEDNHDLDVAHMNNDQFFGILILENNSEGSSSSNIIPTVVHTATPNSEHITKWTK